MRKNNPMRWNAIKSIIASMVLLPGLLFAQADKMAGVTAAKAEFIKKQQSLGLSKADVSDVFVSDAYTNVKTGLTYVYLGQHINGISVHNALANFVVDTDGVAEHVANNFVPNAKSNALTSKSSLSAASAVSMAAKHVGIVSKLSPSLIKAETSVEKAHLFTKGDVASEDISVKLVYVANASGKLHLTWNVRIYTVDREHYWNLFVDANSGDLIEKGDFVAHDNFGYSHHFLQNNQSESASNQSFSPSKEAASAVYKVLALPAESPNHGDFQQLVNPSDAIASAFGWHDTNGAEGPEYTITRGNNVYAYEDTADLNMPGFSPDGGNDLVFKFSVDFTLDPLLNRKAAITNLFYMNNMMHDIFYYYGFDEAAGNFQSNNYGKSGKGNDAVQAEAQDGGGMNNANFATPPDGMKPTMQMYLWLVGTSADLFTVTAPTEIAGVYASAAAGFGAPFTQVPITGKLVLVNDGSATPTLACNTLINASELAGNIAVIDRGTCEFGAKVKKAQDAGAIAAIIVNNTTGLVAMSGGAVGGQVTIPSLMITLEDGNLIKANLANGVYVSLANSNYGAPNIDGDFDNGIIAHEYGHGISNRLTGGPNTTSCLTNREQMGEGWSDYFGLMLTMRGNDYAKEPRGIGTYAISQPVTGLGIRPAPYTTDMSINPYTYADLPNTTLSEPHGIGFVWATMIWDMTWSFINKYGFDSDLKNGTSGNNMALQLVVEGLKLQKCSPGFVDGRNAILKADSILYGAANQELIWTAFARRGLGYSANQGSANNRNDGVAAFDMPPFLGCPVPTNLKSGSRVSNGEIVAQLSWDVVSQASQYSVRYKVKAAKNWLTTTSKTNKVTLTGLKPGATYVWQVASVCGKERSAYSVQQQFKTPSLLARMGDAVDEQSKLSVFPNPSKGSVNVNYVVSDSEAMVYVHIFNAIGQKVATLNGIGGISQTIDLSTLGKGLFVVRAISGDHSATQKIVIE